jgi:hypothetical protein
MQAIHKSVNSADGWRWQLAARKHMPPVNPKLMGIRVAWTTPSSCTLHSYHDEHYDHEQGRYAANHRSQQHDAYDPYHDPYDL